MSTESKKAACPRFHRYDSAISDAHLTATQHVAEALGVPIAFLYADNDVLAEAILTLGLLSKSDQRKAVADLKTRLAETSKQSRGR